MTSRPGLRLIALLVPAVLLAPVPAHAQKVETIDPAADVVYLGPTEQGQEDTDNLLPAPENTTADVVRTVVDHTASRVRVRIDLRELGRAEVYFAVLQVRTPAGTFEVESNEDLARRPKVEMTRRSRAVECPRLRIATDRADARATVTIPTSCLGDPRWVQVGAGIASVETMTGADGAETVTVYADDAHRAGTVDDDALAKGPKVHRG